MVLSILSVRSRGSVSVPRGTLTSGAATCGDGTLLCTLHTAIVGAGLAPEGMLMVGVDYNSDSITATRRTSVEKGIRLQAVKGTVAIVL